VAVCLTKPVKHSDLFDTLATLVLRSAAPMKMSPRRQGQALRGSKRAAARGGTTGHAAAGPPRAARRSVRPLHILVAEDNAANRKLVTALLGERGHRVQSVENGRLALAAIAASRPPGFDVVLMDLEMPEVGGLDATRTLRAGEDPGRPRLPVIALTAHAMPGDRERCLAAGMDAYLSKPIDAAQLFVAVESLGRTAGEAWAPDPPAGGAFDEAGALARTGGNRRLLGQVAALFRTDSETTIRQLDRALGRRDAEAVRVAAHTLKGSAANVGGAAARAVAADLEEMGRSGRLADAPQAIAWLREEVARLIEALRAAGLLGTPGRRAARQPRTRRRARRRS
jgi:CheY-like chemotaxis protein